MTDTITDTEALKAEIKKLSARAVQAKMDLHDLSEELPTNWRSIREVAETAYQAFEVLEAKRALLKEAEAR